MIWGKWYNPNFKFCATDPEGHEYQYFCYAESEQALETRLKSKLLTVKWIKPYDFADWKARAAKATTKIIDAHKLGQKPLNFRGDIWAELKWHLFDLFHGKCAYCEGKTQDVAHGDVEHFRPKSKVDEDPGHPGYYWLAYDETNLLPSCALCNQQRGKMTHFPVAGTHARCPEEIHNEQPLLLNPYNHDLSPFEHLNFSELGLASPRNESPYGAASKQFYHLNRPGLAEARTAAIAQVRRDWNVIIGILTSLQLAQSSLQQEVALGRREYSAAQRGELERICKS